ncbi:MAG: molybdate ABC transporter substrate-binding protein [Myxococcota bacterium]
MRAFVVIAVLALAACKSPPAREVRVAAASDLTDAFTELGRLHEQRTGQKVTFAFGSSGLLAKQLAEGAPFDLFAAANESFVDAAVKAGACDGATKAAYARGRIVVWTKKGGVAPPARLEDLVDARFKRISLANPEHAPYGAAARAALEKAGLWGALEPRLVFGENVRTTLQFAQSGNVDAALVALSLVVADHDNPWLLLPAELHPPLEQALVVCTRGAQQEGARRFAELLASPDGRAVMRKYGFILPGEPT